MLICAVVQTSSKSVTDLKIPVIDRRNDRFCLLGPYLGSGYMGDSKERSGPGSDMEPTSPSQEERHRQLGETA
jgi:hypothetical protein